MTTDENYWTFYKKNYTKNTSANTIFLQAGRKFSSKILAIN